MAGSGGSGSIGALVAVVVALWAFFRSSSADASRSGAPDDTTPDDTSSTDTSLTDTSSSTDTSLTDTSSSTDTSLTDTSSSATPAPAPSLTPSSATTGRRVPVSLTMYLPFATTQVKWEGGTLDRTGKPLYSLEQHLSNPDKYPYCSLSGDNSIWPYGQRVVIDAYPNAVFRIVDTGCYFESLPEKQCKNPSKVIRKAGSEPIDVAVTALTARVPENSTMTVVEGDVLKGSGPAAVQWALLQSYTEATA